MDIDSEISRSIITLLLTEPFFAHLLSGIIRKTSDRIETAAVSLSGSRVTMEINPDFFLKELKDGSARIAVIKHETLHLLFKHLYRFDSKIHHSQIYNLAADLVCNQYIGKWKLPEDAIYLSTFPDLKLEEERETEYYYEKLKSLFNEMCGQGGYNPDGDYSASDFQGTSAPKSARQIHDCLKNGWYSDHLFEEIEAAKKAISEAELDRMIIQAKDRSGPKGWGSIPGLIQTQILNIIDSHTPQVDWRRVMRLFSASSVRTQLKHTIKRASKRFGTRPGIKIKRFQKLAVVIDTSGSISREEYGFFFREIRAMWKEGAEIQIIECDAAVQKVYPYKGKTPDTVFGGGGTSFDPPFEYLREDRMVRYDGCIYLTDGVASEPTIKPPCKLLWVITPQGDPGDHLLWGRVIQMKE